MNHRRGGSTQYVVTDPNSAGPCHHRQRRLHQLHYLMLLFRGHFKLADDSTHVIAVTVAVTVDRRDVLRGKVVYSGVVIPHEFENFPYEAGLQSSYARCWRVVVIQIPSSIP